MCNVLWTLYASNGELFKKYYTNPSVSGITSDQIVLLQHVINLMWDLFRSSFCHYNKLFHHIIQTHNQKFYVGIYNDEVEC